MALNRDRWNQVRSEFEQLLDLPASDRGAALAALAAREPELAPEVEAMLAWHLEAEGFLDQPPALVEEPAPAPRSLPRELGSYRLLEVLGQGGMGTVYRAVRSDDVYRKDVAVKVLERGIDSPDLVARFRAERRILAQLEHPNIAQLFDGGTTPEGQPYFVLELVEGVPIDRFCDAARLDVPARLKLFLKVASAVQLAHQNLVVHRDLKPGNILVGPDGEPKLLDFGIAKLEGTSALDLTLLTTEAGHSPLTPEYASPEQLAGKPVGPLSDVYALGVLLYELLTGRRPYRLSSRRFDELARAVAEQEPERPSAAVGKPYARPSRDGGLETVSAEALAAARSAEPRGLARRLAGDLDVIVLMALRKEPERRYASVEQLIADLTAYLGARPVRARPDTFRYRAGKFLERNRLASVAAALALVALLGFTGMLWRQRQQLLAQREELIRERDHARAVSGFMVEVFSMPDPTRSRGVRVTARELLDGGVGKIDRELADSPEAKADMQLTMGRSYKGLGLFAEAGRLFEAALEGRRSLYAAEDPRVAEGLHELAEVTFFEGRFAEAERLERAALPQLERQGPEPHARGLLRLARTLHELGRLDEAAATFERARQVAAQFGDRALTAAIEARFGSLEHDRDRWREAEELYRRALATQLEVLGAQHPDVAVTEGSLGTLLKDRGRLDEAEALWRETERRLQGLEGYVHPNRVKVLNNLALVELERGRFAEAEAALAQALALLETQEGEDHPARVLVLLTLADLRDQQGRAEEAEQLYRQALDQRRRTLSPHHPETAQAANDLAIFLQRQGRFEESQPLLEEALVHLRTAVGNDHSSVALILGNLAFGDQNLGRAESALARYREALGIYRRSQAVRPDKLGSLLYNLASLERQLELRSEAHEHLAEAVELFRTSFGGRHVRTAMAELWLADLKLANGELEAAERLAREVETVFAEHLEAEDPWRRSASRLLVRCLIQGRRFPEAETMARSWLAKGRGALGERERAILIELYEAWGKKGRVAQLRSAEPANEGR